MREEKIFLTADWNYLLLFNYAVSQHILTPFLPKGCELALWNDQAFISIVGFQFNNTRVFKIKWSYFTHFIEINLRFYVYYKDKRAVCFIREYVPSYLIAGIARVAYNEPYKTRKITTHLKKTNETLRLQYGIPVKNHPFTIRATVDNKPYIPDKNSEEFFFKEHDLGVGQTRNGKTLIYKVHHPEWKVFPIKNKSIEIDWAFFFGSTFTFLENKEPDSVFLAKGSAVEVYNHTVV